MTALQARKPASRSTSVGPYALHAKAIAALGCAPIPEAPQKRFGPKRWTEKSVEELAGLLANPNMRKWYLNHDLGIRFDAGLIGLDIDTEDPNIRRAIWRTLQRHGIAVEDLVGKRGSKGATLFGFDRTGSIVARQFKRPAYPVPVGEGNVFLEILAGPKRKTTLPPTLHPKTKRPYIWLFDRTLFNISSLEELPAFTPDLIADIAKAVDPWTVRWRPCGYRQHQKAVLRDDDPNRRWAAMLPEDREFRKEVARSEFEAAAANLSGMSDGSGRNYKLFQILCHFGVWMQKPALNPILNQADCFTRLHSAYVACGAAKDHGDKQFLATWKSGLRKSRSDALRIPQPWRRQFPATIPFPRSSSLPSALSVSAR